jgi:hypothetical protein
MIGGSEETVLAILRFVRYTRHAERLDDPVPGEGFRGDVRQVLQRLLTPARRPSNALSEADERIEHQGRAGETDDRQARVVPEQQKGVTHQRERLANQIADRLGDRLLDLPDVVGHARHQLAARAAGEEPGGLAQDVLEEPAPDVEDDPLPHVGHEVHGRIRAEALEQVGAEDERRHEAEMLARRQHFVEDRLDLQRQQPRRAGIEEHRRQRGGKPAAVRPGEAKQAEEGAHSLWAIRSRPGSGNPSGAAIASARRFRRWCRAPRTAAASPAPS